MIISYIDYSIFCPHNICITLSTVIIETGDILQSVYSALFDTLHIRAFCLHAEKLLWQESWCFHFICTFEILKLCHKVAFGLMGDCINLAVRDQRSTSAPICWILVKLMCQAGNFRGNFFKCCWLWSKIEVTLTRDVHVSDFSASCCSTMLWTSIAHCSPPPDLWALGNICWIMCPSSLWVTTYFAWCERELQLYWCAAAQR